PENAFLFFDGPDEDDDIQNYNERLREIIEVLVRLNHRVVIKPPPRVSCSLPLRDDARLAMLPAYVPGEFLPTRRYSAVLGIGSTALGEAGIGRGGQGVYSLIHLFEWRNPSDRDFYVSLLRRNARNHITFLGTWQDLAAIAC